jgi:hypothetical protein
LVYGLVEAAEFVQIPRHLSLMIESTFGRKNAKDYLEAK